MLPAHFVCLQPPLISSVSRHMKRRDLTLAAGCSALGVARAEDGDVTMWATATSKHETNGRMIVFRFAKDFRAGFDKGSLPDRVTLVWRYTSDSGLPVVVERQAMDRMEDSLEAALDRAGSAVLALVTTGGGVREWVYYVKSEQQFVKLLNHALAGSARFPIEIQTARDAQWAKYERFRRGIIE
jgi:hypothetical protein